MQTQVIDGATYTYVDDETYKLDCGFEWVLWEKPDVLDKIRWADKQMARWAKKMATDYDAACLYMEALEIRTSAEGDLDIIEQLWG